MKALLVVLLAFSAGTYAGDQEPMSYINSGSITLNTDILVNASAANDSVSLMSLQGGQVFTSLLQIDPELPVCSIVLTPSTKNRIIKAGRVLKFNDAIVQGTTTKIVTLKVNNIEAIKEIVCAYKVHDVSENNWFSHSDQVPSVKDFKTVLGSLFEVNLNTSLEEI